MRKFKMELVLENAAFEDDMQGEIASLLEDAAVKVTEGYVTQTLRDTNGNIVGAWVIGEVPDEKAEGSGA